MIPKIIPSDSFDYGDPAVSLVPLHSRGVDDQWMRKHANHGLFHQFLDGLRPQKNKTIIHVIAVGDEEIYGPNRNCDGFSREDNVTAHSSFKDIGHVFKNHQNDDPFKAVGDVMQTAHNNQMSRIELLLALDNAKCYKEVDALESGGDIPVSMGSMQDYDVCSICQHKAPTARDHCNHIKQMLGSVFDDGRRVYMKNPKPKYFDISLVFKPADRIAYTLRKVAAAHGVVGGHELAEAFGIRPWNSPKTAALRSLAAMVKQVPMSLQKATEPIALKDSTKDELKKQAKVQGIDHLLAFLHANGWLLGPSDFGEIIGHKDPMGCAGAVESAPGIEDLLEDMTEIPSLDAPILPNPITLSPSAIRDLDESASMLPGPANGRVLKVTIIKPATKVAYTLDPNEAAGFALLYKHYKLAFATQHQDRPGVMQALAATF